MPILQDQWTEWYVKLEWHSTVTGSLSLILKFQSNVSNSINLSRANTWIFAECFWILVFFSVEIGGFFTFLFQFPVFWFFFSWSWSWKLCTSLSWNILKLQHSYNRCRNMNKRCQRVTNYKVNDHKQEFLIIWSNQCYYKQLMIHIVI